MTKDGERRFVLLSVRYAGVIMMMIATDGSFCHWYYYELYYKRKYLDRERKRMECYFKPHTAHIAVYVPISFSSFFYNPQFSSFFQHIVHRQTH